MYNVRLQLQIAIITTNPYLFGCVFVCIQFDPAQWTTEQVCKWLELVGLGTFKEIFEGELIDEVGIW